jgi:hypothetical protein
LKSIRVNQTATHIQSHAFLTAKYAVYAPQSGETLAAMVDSKDQGLAAQVQAVGVQIGNALRWLHAEHHVVYAQLQPELIVFHQGKWHLLMAPLCAVRPGSSDSIAAIAGANLRYLAPEYVRADGQISADAAMDVWSVGVLLLELLSTNGELFPKAMHQDCVIGKLKDTDNFRSLVQALNGFDNQHLSPGSGLRNTLLVEQKARSTISEMLDDTYFTTTGSSTDTGRVRDRAPHPLMMDPEVMVEDEYEEEAKTPLAAHAQERKIHL